MRLRVVAALTGIASLLRRLRVRMPSGGEADGADLWAASTSASDHARAHLCHPFCVMAEIRTLPRRPWWGTVRGRMAGSGPVVREGVRVDSLGRKPPIGRPLGAL
ncbi:hypothetical protein HEK131_04210 [Streptomyces seoulensis]|nr:hypothetical protein HEK131_04210 [Streptomyces seoulensis]